VAHKRKMGCAKAIKRAPNPTTAPLLALVGASMRSAIRFEVIGKVTRHGRYFRPGASRASPACIAGVGHGFLRQKQ